MADENKDEVVVPKIVMVTGGEGFLGAQVVADLRSRGHECHTYDFVSGQDILDKAQFLAALVASKATSCIHLAAVADLYIMKAQPERSERINIDGTKNVIDCCVEAGVRCLFASTCCAYGNNECHPSNEDSPLCPTEIYAKSKKTGETFINAAGAPHTCLRLATFYGPTMRMALVMGVFLDLVHRGKDLKVHGSGLQTRTYTYVEDIVSGIRTVLENDQVHFPAVNISTDVSVNVLEVAEYAMRAVGQRVKLEHGEDRAGQIFIEEIDNTRLRSLGWKPSRTFEQGMADSYAGLLNGFLKDVPLVARDAYDAKDTVIPAKDEAAAH